MKPTLQIPNKNGRDSSVLFRSPKTDQSFRADSRAEFSGRCSGTPAPSFRSISNEYFDKEARGHFVGEAAMFLLMVATAAVPVIEGCRGAVPFLRILGLL